MSRDTENPFLAVGAFDDHQSVPTPAADMHPEEAADAIIAALASGASSETAGLRFAKALTEYGVHHGNCPYDSWSKRLTRCKCGLFQLIKEAERALAATTVAGSASEESGRD